MTWWMYALSAAVVWGIHYNLLSRSMTVISPITAYWLPTVIMIVGLPFFYKTLIHDYHAVMDAPIEVKLSTLIISFTSFTASMMLYKAIQMHNPVHVGLIEITYPIFVAIFAYLIFQQNQLSWGTAIGGAFIIVGSGIVIYNQS